VSRAALFAVGAVLAGIGVTLGAFGAHALEARLTAERLATFETAVRYQMLHALAILAAALLGGERAAFAGLLFLAGIALFSGSLYLLVLTGVRWLGAITPLGGVAFIAGWGVLALAGLRGLRG
jgi:uncharacterized membrane protein YgdD (TMEM256/DUF423 family)